VRDAAGRAAPNGEVMGASSGWNLVARRQPRVRAASKKQPARHLVSVPSGPRADTGRRPGEPQHASRAPGAPRDTG
jgi:hypothetical protein